MKDRNGQSGGKPAGKSGKKSETLEVRLPYETKRDFLDACRSDGTTASEVVRQSIDGYLDQRTRAAEATDPQRPADMNILEFIPRPLRRPRVFAGALGAVAMTAIVALPSAANPDFRSVFDNLDKNKDGVLTAEEFGGPRLTSGDGKPGHILIEKRVIKRDEDGTVEETETIEHDGEIVKEIKRGDLTIDLGAAVAGGEAYAFWLPSEAGEGGDTGKTVTLMHMENQIRVTTDGDVANHEVRPSAFSAFDADGDGKISFTEFEMRQRTLLTNGFNRLDADKNGSLTIEEYAAIGSPIVLRLGDGDAKLSDEIREKLKVSIPGVDPEAMKAKAQERFTTLDTNADGKLSLQEYLP